jgi:hypothetical protein
MNTAPITVVNIISTAFSGSTWLNLMLGSHSAAFSVGEIKHILRVGHARCTLHGEACPFWSRWPAQMPDDPFGRIAEMSGQRVLVVNNSRKLLGHQQSPRFDARYVHLIRDGRAVTASMLRKYPRHSVWSAARAWSHDLRRNRRLVRRQDPAKVLAVTYERLKADAASELARICAFLGLPFEPAMTEYWTREHHFLGGNRGTLTMVAKQHNLQLPPSKRQLQGHTKLTNWDLKHYEKADPKKFADERWKSELSDNQLRLFGLLAGRLNRSLGYSKSLDRG